MPCSQGDETRLDCRKRNLLYENRCELCNDTKKDGKGIYVGETSRSLYERAKEHEADRNKTSEDSHHVKHWLTDHQDLLAPPNTPVQVLSGSIIIVLLWMSWNYYLT